MQSFLQTLGCDSFGLFAFCTFHVFVSVSAHAQCLVFPQTDWYGLLHYSSYLTTMWSTITQVNVGCFHVTGGLAHCVTVKTELVNISLNFCDENRIKFPRQHVSSTLANAEKHDRRQQMTWRVSQIKLSVALRLWKHFVAVTLLFLTALPDLTGLPLQY